MGCRKPVQQCVLKLNIYSEVYKARSKKDNAVVALKKILMHNERDGVR